VTSPLAAPRFSGRPVTRVDGRLKVTGRAPYAADHPVPEVAYAAMVGATVARGRVAGIDTGAARRHPGVIRVLTEFRGVTLPFDPHTIESFGQPVAVVVAETLEAATHAATLVEVRYAAAAAVTDIDAPQAQAQPGGTARTVDHARGDADAALRSAEVRVDLRFTMPRNNHNPMELPSTIARWDGDRLTVYDKVQAVASAQQTYAQAFGIPTADVEVRSPYVGGAFGHAGRIWPHSLLAAFAARELGRPVKITLPRRQFYTTVGYRPTNRQRLAIGADRTGRLSAIVHEARVEKSHNDGYEDNVTGVPRFMYSVPNVRSTYRAVALDVNPPTFTRAPGTVSGVFALENAIDELAFRLGMDPIELRLRNEPARDESRDLPWSTRRLTECFRQGAETFGWSRRNPTPRAVRDGHQLVGMGTAAAVYHALAAACAVSVRLNPDGTADVQTGTIDMGPGTYTAMTQVASDALGLPMNRVRFALGDSRMPPAPVHGASQTMASVGSGVLTASNLLRDRFIRTAVVDPGSPLSGLRPDEVTVIDGRMVAAGEPSRGETYQQLLRRRGWGPLDATETWTPNESDHGAYAMHSYGAVFAEVSVDEQLGIIRVRRLHAVYDAGRIINPLLAHSQAIGGMVGGIGMALLESTELDHRDGRIVNANMSDYLVPVHADIGELDAAFLAGEDPVLTPLGVKGLAELVFVGVPAAIGNAVFNATGRRVTELPITLDRLI